MRRQKRNGSVDNKIYRTLIFIETLKSVGKGNTREIRKALKWVLRKKKNGKFSNDIWLNSLTVRVLIENGIEIEKMKETIEWIKSKRDDKNSWEGKCWLTSYAVAALHTCGEDVENSIAWIMKQKKKDHWEDEEKSNILVTSLIFDSLKRIGIKDKESEKYLRDNLDDKLELSKLISLIHILR